MMMSPAWWLAVGVFCNLAGLAIAVALAAWAERA